MFFKMGDFEKTDINKTSISYSLGKYTCACTCVCTSTSKTFQTAENSFPKNARSCDDRREEFSCRRISDIGLLLLTFTINLLLEKSCQIINLFNHKDRENNKYPSV